LTTHILAPPEAPYQFKGQAVCLVFFVGVRASAFAERNSQKRNIQQAFQQQKGALIYIRSLGDTDQGQLKSSGAWVG
jgi:hypothetical protein